MNQTTPLFELKVDLNVLNHLGIGLYSSTPAVVTEIVANAWDADATRVDITIKDNEIHVYDNGHGMGKEELQERFLTVGYARREQPGGALSPRFHRPVMGRKGIGKLAMFSLANRIDIWSKKIDTPAVDGAIQVEILKSKIKQNIPYTLDPVKETYDWGKCTGTRIVLSQLNTGTDKTEAFLRPRIARRFSVLGQAHSFQVFINNNEVTPGDRGYQSDIQFLWHLDSKTESHLLSLTNNLAKDENKKFCSARIENKIFHESLFFELRGFIATVKKPSQLKKTDDNINQISLFANGRVFQEDMLKDIGNARVFNSYLVGEIHADFLDTDEIDRATANRESVKTGDPLVATVREWLKTTLGTIAEQWDEWRRQQKPDAEDDQMQLAIEKWVNSLPEPHDRRLAKRLISPILSAEHSNNKTTNKAIKSDLLKSAIIGFERLRARQQLELLANIKDVLSPQFQAIFNTVDALEAEQYHDITKNRLRVIEYFERDIVDTKALEKVAQNYLFDHLWLLDPTWGPIAESGDMEVTLTKELKKISPDNETGARLDITYRTSSGRHAIVELKRPGLRAVDVDDLCKQGKKYLASLSEYLRKHPDMHGLDGRIPPIDVYFVTEELPKTTFGDALAQLRQHNMQCFTYRGMISNARSAYNDYLNQNKHCSNIDDIIKNIV